MSEIIKSPLKTNSSNIIKHTATLQSTKIIFNKIILLEDNNISYKSSYYLSLILNNLQPQNSKYIEFSKNCECKINQAMSLDNGEPKKKYIKIELYQKDKNKKLYSNLILKGEIINENYIYDNASGDFICYLKNNEGEDKAIVYFTLDYGTGNIINNDAYNKNVKRIEKVNKKSLANEANIHNLFLINLQYIKLISNDINDLFNWTDKWRTLSYLFTFTFIVIFFKIFYVFIFPLYLIFVHINNKNNIEKFIITKDSFDNSNNKKTNKMIFYHIMYIFNRIVYVYENIMYKIINEKQIMHELYTRIGIAIIANVCFFHFKIYNLINFKAIIIFFVWFYVLRRNPSFYSFSIFIYNIIQERTLFITSRENYFYYKTNFLNLISILIPFYSLYRLYQEEKIDSNTFLYNEKNKNNNLIKYEIYENERWWMFVGWNKDLIYDESPVWYKAEKPKEYCDKNMVKLLGGENGYKWVSEWKILLGDNTDNNGWEYSNDFNQNFGRKTQKQNVRRRKWVRYASKI